MHHYEQDVPNGWCKTALSEIITLLSGRDLQPTQYNSFEKGIPYITGASNIDNNTIIINRWTTAPITISHKGDLLITCKGTIGKLAFNSVGDLHIARQLMSLQFIEPLVSKYLFYCLEERISAIKQMDNGLIPGIDRSIILNQIIQLPPLAEQHRIVAEIERWFTLVDTIEQGKENLETSIKQAKGKILDLAIHGKLVPQDASDEPASELLKRINPKAQITCDNEHYPSMWHIAMLGDLFTHNTGKALNSANKEGKLKDYLTTSNVYWNRFDFSVVKQMPFKENELDKCTVAKGDLLVCEGGDVGRSAIWTYDYNICIQNHIHRLRSKEGVYTPFYYYVLKSYKAHNIIGGKGIGLLGLSSKELHKILFPVPPFAEQKRIVQKIEELFPLLDCIEQTLQA